MSCVFFFFKQKTGYDMRISDWSSDVCSSDLAHAREDEGQCCCSEHFKETFYPQVHHPPAPVLHDGDVSAFAIEQTSAIEQADGNGGRSQQGQQRSEERRLGTECVITGKSRVSAYH